MLKVVQEYNESNHDEPNGAGVALLDEIVRDGARQMLTAALQAEVAAFVEAHAGDERPRLTAIRDNLLARITEAEASRWLGEAEGLKVSLAGARDKLAQMDQISARRNAAVDLGIPNFSEAAGRTLNTSPDGAQRK